MSNKILNSLSVDAACSGNPGIMEYRGVFTATGEEIFHQGPFQQGTNNIGEFLALVHGLALLKKQNSTIPVYSDSVSAMAWVRNKKAKTTLEHCEANKILFELLARAENWLKTNTCLNPILKWETREWGEIPADFGRK
ncbi:MAG: Ribonuclease H [Candidatus Ordinivivax streblomastigis]|uniref:Ribonuclease H n=1 Tax=Candidatus Ordinivivax streblomastigis TaxID=2540710 RepID=A0A5M8P5C4_9BACT|nr:MAG: Ribonuclease H [Candidatus Ordinivivax streblomastigis]